MGVRTFKITLIASLALLVLAAQASAHAYPITTGPPIGGVVKASPTTVSITYDEAVTVPALAVYDAAGKLVSSATVTHPAPARIAVAIPGRLPDGTYTVAWRVTSADTHVVHGVYTFSVGERGRAGRIGAELLARGNTPESISLGFGIVRFFNLVLLLGCCGGAIALLWTLRDADDEVQLKLLRALAIIGALLALLAVLGLPFQAAEVSGTQLSGGFGKLALETVRHQRFGEDWLVRAWLAVVFAMIAISLQIWKRRRQMARQLLLAAAGVGLLLTSTDAGHASVSGTVAFVADAVHITAAAVWMGGLAFLLAAILLSRPERRWTLAAVSVPRFSLTATFTVPILGAAGIVLADIEVHAWRGFWDTTSGLLILAKIGLVLPLVALAAFNNRVAVPALRAGAATGSIRTHFVRAVGAELTILLAVIGVTAALIDEATARSVLASQRPTGASSFTASRSAGPFEATVTLHPALAGANTVEMKVTSTRHLTIGEVDLAASSPEGRPLNLNVVQLSGSRFQVTGAELRQPGRWELELTVRHGLTEYLARIPVTIGRAGR